MENVFVAVAILGVFVILAGRVRVICLAERKKMIVNLSEYFEQYRFEPITTYTVNKIKYDLNEIVPDFYSKGAVKLYNNPLQIEISYNGKIVCVLN